MDNDVNAWLYDVLNAIMEIDGFFNNVTKEFSSYKNDLRTCALAGGSSLIIATEIYSIPVSNEIFSSLIHS